MAEDLRALATKYITLTEEIEATRRAMLTALTANGAGGEVPKTNPFVHAERPGKTEPQARLAKQPPQRPRAKTQMTPRPTPKPSQCPAQRSEHWCPATRPQQGGGRGGAYASRASNTISITSAPSVGMATALFHELVDLRLLHGDAAHLSRDSMRSKWN